MLVCYVAQEAGVPHHEYIDRQEENVIFHTHVASRSHIQMYQNLLQRFSQGRQHYMPNLKQITQVTSKQNFISISSFFFLFHTVCIFGLKT